MKILITPLNWGLGHASRSMALVVRYLRQGDDVVLAGDGESGVLLKKSFPGLKYYALPSLELHYGRGNNQVLALAAMLPRLAVAAWKDHQAIQQIIRQEHIDLLISDNRFGCFSKLCRCVYLTHQLHIRLPHHWQWAEPIAERIHARIICRYDECWVPDYEGEPNLAGELSHPVKKRVEVKYIGPLSRLPGRGKPVVPTDQPRQACAPGRAISHAAEVPGEAFDVVAVLSGLEPQRSMLEREVMQEWLGKEEKVLIIRGKMNLPPTTTQKKNITLRPYASDAELRDALLNANIIISRSGYSSIMDYAALGLLEKARRGEIELRLVATPGQSEQEYLADIHNHTLILC